MLKGHILSMASHGKDLFAAKASTAHFEDRSDPRLTSWSYRKRYKRWLDILFVLLAAPIVVPLVAMFALIIASDGASPFYRQRRVGKNGKVFEMLKIRTMVVDAEEQLEAYLERDPEARAEWGRTQKLKNDPRITAMGKFLRKSSLDELPQLWNVLRGDMSIVGPRPMMVDQQPLYPGLYYYALRPGITGPWQVSDRNETTFSARAEFDNDYYRDLSLKTDLALLARTVGVVLRCTGY